MELLAVLLISLLASLSEDSDNDGNDGLFTSSSDLESLLDTEAELVRALKDYVKVEEDRIIKIKR